MSDPMQERASPTGARVEGWSSSARHGLALSEAWASAALLIPVAVLTSTPLVAVDLAYHLRAGALIVSTHSLLRTDPFTFTAAGLPWLNQQWGAEILLHTAFQAAGWLGLAVLRGGLAAGALGFVYLACRQGGADRRRAAWLTLGSFTLAFAGLQLRPQAFGMVCFAATLWLVAGRERHPGRLWLVLPVTVAWANLHGSFFLGPLVLGLAWVDDRVHRAPGARRTLAAASGALFATIVTPFGPRVWSYVVSLYTNPVIRHQITEWRPTGFTSSTGVIFFLSVATAGAWLLRRGGDLPWPSYLMLAVFLAIGVSSARGVYWWGFCLPVVLARVPASRARRVRADPVNPLNTALVALIASVAATAFVPWLSHGDQAQPGSRFLSYAPAGITSELHRILEPGERLYAAQVWGSWFELALPDNPVAVDSRIEIVPRTVWDLNGRVSNAEEGWQAILDRWSVRVVALLPWQDSALIRAMKTDPLWTLAYEDADGFVFVRG